MPVWICIAMAFVLFFDCKGFLLFCNAGFFLLFMWMTKKMCNKVGSGLICTHVWIGQMNAGT